MRFLLLNQTFHPDVASTAQHLTDLALALVERGHQVTVLTSRRAYDNPALRFPRSEIWRGVRIIRISSTGFGKSARWRRAADFGSFLFVCALRLAFLPRHDAVVALTSPPLISFLAAWLARLRGARFFYWVMDFNPDEAIVAGWLRPGSLLAKMLDSMSRFSLRQATRIIALDRFMRDRIIAKGISPDKILVLPPWSHDTEVRFDPVGRDQFRQAHGLTGKFVVMYSGNHSPCHPLDTLLQAAKRLAGRSDIVFCFIGGGSEWKKFRALTSSLSPLPSPLFLPYQPLNQLSSSLSAADLHVVVMGDPFVGLVHPCKIYNILRVGAPVLYIGPRSSHLSEILSRLNGTYLCANTGHGEVEATVNEILRLRDRSSVLPQPIPNLTFSKSALLPRLLTALESPAAN